MSAKMSAKKPSADDKKLTTVVADDPNDLKGTLRRIGGSPDKPAASYRRLSRYDLTGLLWLLHGRPVAALTVDTATIQCPAGGVITYRRHHKPALGPLGDSLDDFR